ncbi:MAG: bifunctional riboflavin kinase/FAD synthetase, partial [Bdellovibrionota bacterium]
MGMEVFRGHEALSRTLVSPVVTIGNFDGVHLGHQKIIELAVSKARSLHGTCVAYTFRPHPQVALRPGANVQLLSTYDEKLDLMAGLGVDVTIEEPFSREFSTTHPEQFFKEILLRELSARAIVVGYDFAFGKEREGHLDTLRTLCAEAGVELTVVQPQRQGEDVVSSSRIRQYLLSGDVADAARLLGREFFYRGVVVRGEGRGRKIGFPTANLKLENKLALPYGVYATWAVVREAGAPVSAGTRVASVTNVGVRPTFRGDGPELPALVETHLLNMEQDLYGKTLDVRFVKRLREERKFSGIAELKSQIAKDAAEA